MYKFVLSDNKQQYEGDQIIKSQGLNDAVKLRAPTSLYSVQS